MVRLIRVMTASHRIGIAIGIRDIRIIRVIAWVTRMRVIRVRKTPLGATSPSLHQTSVCSPVRVIGSAGRVARMIGAIVCVPSHATCHSEEFAQKSR